MLGAAELRSVAMDERVFFPEAAWAREFQVVAGQAGFKKAWSELEWTVPTHRARVCCWKLLGPARR